MGGWVVPNDGLREGAHYKIQSPDMKQILGIYTVQKTSIYYHKV